MIEYFSPAERGEDDGRCSHQTARGEAVSQRERVAPAPSSPEARDDDPDSSHGVHLSVLRRDGEREREGAPFSLRAPTSVGESWQLGLERFPSHDQLVVITGCRGVNRNGARTWVCVDEMHGEGGARASADCAHSPGKRPITRFQGHIIKLPHTLTMVVNTIKSCRAGQGLHHCRVSISAPLPAPPLPVPAAVTQPSPLFPTSRGTGERTGVSVIVVPTVDQSTGVHVSVTAERGSQSLSTPPLPGRASTAHKVVTGPAID